MNFDRVCYKICSAFDYDEATNPFQWGSMKDGKSPNLGQFMNDLVSREQWKDLKKWNKDLTERDRQVFEESVALVYRIPFAVGYVIGQILDIPSPEVQKEIDKIKNLLREKALLPYLPREKKGGNHEKVNQ